MRSRTSCWVVSSRFRSTMGWLVRTNRPLSVAWRTRSVQARRSSGLAALGAERENTIAPGVLGRVHGRLGLGEKLRADDRSLVEGGDPGAQRDPKRLPRDHERVLPGALEQLLGDRDSLRPVGSVDEDPEDVAADSGQDVGPAEAPAHHLDELDQQLIAGSRPERLVDVLEGVDAEREHAAAVAVAGRVVDVSGERMLEARAVRQSRQGVLIGHLVQARLCPLPFAYVARHGGE